jgi:predicted RNA-binding Zn ribbon-like protein
VRSTVTDKPLPLLGGAICLDFVNTIDPRLKPPQEDFLATFKQLVRWGLYAGVLSAAEERALLMAGAGDSRFAASVHERALTLREALYELLRPPRRQPQQALEVLNRELSRTVAARVLLGSRDHYRFSWPSEAADDQLLGVVAESASELLTSSALARVRQCPGDGCGWLFLDTSKAHRRRWCSMAVCGNRAKAQRHRQRGRATNQTMAGGNAGARALSALTPQGGRRRAKSKKTSMRAQDGDSL